MKNGNVPFEDAVKILRRTLFPFMHDPHPWVAGMYYTVSVKQYICIAIGVFASQIFINNIRRESGGTC
jgi:hypothetical protein